MATKKKKNKIDPVISTMVDNHLWELAAAYTDITAGNMTIKEINERITVLYHTFATRWGDIQE